MAQHVKVVSYDPKWPEIYEREKNLILQILGEEAVSINHIGSTSVPGLAAKPIIDIMPVVRDISKVDWLKSQFESIGYEYMGEFGMPGRRYLRKGGDERTHQIHIFEACNKKDVLRHLAVRDYLRLHGDAREAYGTLKRQVAAQYPEDIEGYCNGKDAFVKNLEAKACAWYERTKGAAYLFDGWQETMIWSCLQEHMGTVETDGSLPPASARISVGDFSFFAGLPDEKLIQNAKTPILGPRTENWEPVIEKVLGAEAVKAQRYAIKKEPNVFDRETLEQYVASLPADYELKPIDLELYEQIMAAPWAKDLCSRFCDGHDYVRRGVGFAVVYRGCVVAGASSYAVYDNGIEIEIDTNKEYRNQGLALACGSRLILECLNRGLYPSWDAHDLRSVRLAEKLGYHKDSPYNVYFLKSSCAELLDA